MDATRNHRLDRKDSIARNYPSVACESCCRGACSSLQALHSAARSAREIHGTMRTRALALIAGAVSACLLVQFVPAQDTVEKDTHHGGLKKWIDLLPGGEQVKLKAVHALAMEDPAVRAADEKRKQTEKEFQDILRAAMLKIDPTVQPILDKMPEPKKQHHWW
jgi:hypothetical protein